MPVRKSKLYNAFGEIMYSLAMADGKIQKEELHAITTALKNHEWSSGILWSFDYENEKQRNTADILKRALKVFRENGPSKEYRDFLSSLKLIAAASNGIDNNEAIMITEIEKVINDINQ